jgi:hypothetical protein
MRSGESKNGKASAGACILSVLTVGNNLRAGNTWERDHGRSQECQHPGESDQSNSCQRPDLRGQDVGCRDQIEELANQIFQSLRPIRQIRAPTPHNPTSVKVCCVAKPRAWRDVTPLWLRSLGSRGERSWMVIRIAGIRYTTVPNTHISAPAITWSSNGETLRSGGVEAYVRYRTRSQNTRNAPSAPPGRVPKNKYRGVDHRGHRASLGKGSTTGHQNRSDVAKKHACSTSCQESERSANSNAAGICHPISAAVAATQQNAG